MSKGLRRRTTTALFVLAITLPSYGAPAELTRTSDPWWSDLVEVLAEWMSPWSHQAGEIEGLPPVASDEPIPEYPANFTTSTDQPGGETETHPDLDPHG